MNYPLSRFRSSNGRTYGRPVGDVAAGEARQVVNVLHYEGEGAQLRDEAQEVGEERNSLVFDVCMGAPGNLT